MTFPSAGTQNAVQAALGISAAQVTTALANRASNNYPVQLQHGAERANWADPGLINIMNVIWIEANTVYRM